MYLATNETPFPNSLNGGGTKRRRQKTKKGTKSELSERKPQPARRSRPRGRDERETIAKITKPLSQIALENPGIHVNDPVKFACRSVEDRHLSMKEGDRIKRPLNVFMLYRKTYQEVAKTLCTKPDHQHVSAICGKSWRELEPKRVRDKFKQLAEVESKKHIEAHPGYKYIPVPGKRTKTEMSSEPPDRNDNIDDENDDTASQLLQSQLVDPAALPRHAIDGTNLYGEHPIQLPQFDFGRHEYWERYGSFQQATPPQSLDHAQGNAQGFPRYAHPHDLYNSYGHMQNGNFDGINMGYSSSIEPSTLSRKQQPMTSGYDPLLSCHGGPVSPYASAAAAIYPPLDAQSGWQPHLAQVPGLWNSMEMNDPYLSKQDEWKIEELEPSQFDRYFDRDFDEAVV
ncbi:Transcription factor ste11 [Paramyrothecium foliicola]|nr:Transcription factor ste11 [Paramyrothecium foliicola]